MEDQSSYKVTDRRNASLAWIVLNGQRIVSQGPLGKQGEIRSFRIVEGDLWEQWSIQQTLLLHNGDGTQSAVRVVAFPAEEDSTGLLEFV